MTGSWTGAQKKYTCECGNRAHFPTLVKTVKFKDGCNHIEYLEFCNLCKSSRIKWDE